MDEGENMEVWCLHVSTRMKSKKSGRQLGYLTKNYMIFNVLYVEKSQEDGRRYRRIGVGRIFEKIIARGFQTGNEETIELE